MEQLLAQARQLFVLRLSKSLPSYQRGLYNKLVGQKSRILGIYGARGVGKTTLMLQYLKSLSLPTSEVLYISCDHPILKGISLFDFMAHFQSMGGKAIFIDEIHEARDFEQALKSAYDFLELKIVFSGSSAIALTNPDFTRRYAMHALPKLSLREYLEIRLNLSLPTYALEHLLEQHLEISVEILLALGEHKILPLFKDYLLHGGYPFYFEDEASFIQKLSDSIILSIDVDLAKLCDIHPDKLDMLKKLLTVICRAKPFEMAIDKLAASVEISKPTLYRYLDYLEKGELLRCVPNELKKHKQVRRPDKLYLHHPNLFQALCLHSEVGTIREVFFASQLGFEHLLAYSNQADFLVDEQWLFEIGGANKDFTQLADSAYPSFVVADDLEVGSGRKIPLWLFGFLY